MLKGGYQILDLQNKNLRSGIGMIIDGAYDKVAGNRKVILVSGLNYDGREYRDTFVEFHNPNGQNTTYRGTIYGNTITVETNDEVTVTS